MHFFWPFSAPDWNGKNNHFRFSLFSLQDFFWKSDFFTFQKRKWKWKKWKNHFSTFPEKVLKWKKWKAKVKSESDYFSLSNVWPRGYFFNLQARMLTHEFMEIQLNQHTCRKKNISSSPWQCSIKTWKI